MRLLKTRTCQLVEASDIPNPFPQYAILSHTWISSKDEITYQDLKQKKDELENGTFKPQGWAKLRGYCDRAVRDGWEWAWMDTCCIDKTSLVETQVAINARFRWYQNSGICYAHLDAVDASEVIEGPVSSGSGQSDLDTVVRRDCVADPTSFAHIALKDFLIKAKWFTRGWTLQELLAPLYLVFVDKKWRRLGTREIWAEEIKEASKIDTRHLTSFDPTNPTSCSIATRLPWASRRETAIEEDEIYSLLGLFGIALPLNYGEGRWKAFNRLQLELINIYDDDSILAWKTLQQDNSDLERSILAPSIREYWDASEIEAFGLYAPYGSSFSITNSGLEITSKRWRSVDDSRCLIRLNCGFEISRRIVIPLEQHMDGFHRIHHGELWDMSAIETEGWVEEPGSQVTVVQVSNYTSKKYVVDFRTPNSSVAPKLLPKPLDLMEEVIMEANQLVFINIELQNKWIKNFYDVVINTTERNFPTVGVLARDDKLWERLGDPLSNVLRPMNIWLSIFIIKCPRSILLWWDKERALFLESLISQNPGKRGPITRH